MFKAPMRPGVIVAGLVAVLVFDLLVGASSVQSSVLLSSHIERARRTLLHLTRLNADSPGEAV